MAMLAPTLQSKLKDPRRILRYRQSGVTIGDRQYFLEIFTLQKSA